MADFDTETVEQIPEAQRILPAFQGVLTEGQSIASKIQGIIQSTPAPGSQAERLKDVFTRTVPTGKVATVHLQIAIVRLEDA